MSITFTKEDILEIEDNVFNAMGVAVNTFESLLEGNEIKSELVKAAKDRIMTSSRFLRAKLRPERYAE